MSTTPSTFIRNVYKNVLQREGAEVTDAELLSWDRLISSNVLTQAQVTNAIVSSAEGQTVAQIVRLYQTLFNRAPDAAGLNVQVDAVRTGQITLTQLYRNFAESAEFTSVYGAASSVTGATLTSFLTAVYQNVLGRAPDSAGLASWVAFFNANGANVSAVAQIARGFADSAEFISIATPQTNALLTNSAQSGITATGTLAAASGVSSNAVAGSTFSLSANNDVLNTTTTTAANRTTAGDDTIYANTAGDFSGGDIIDAGGGTDTLFSVQTTAAATLTPILTSVERVYIDLNDGTAGTAHTYEFSGATSTGLQQVWANAVSGSTDGKEDTFKITNVGLTVTTGIKGGDGEYNVTTVYTGATGSTDSASLALSTASVDTVTIANVETLNVSNADGNSTIATLTADKMTTLNISGSKNVTITNAFGFDGTSGTINASSFTGNLSLNASTGNDNVTFTGGSGTNTVTTGNGNDKLTGGAAADTFTVGTGNDTVTGGAGNDRVVFADTADFTADDSISLGEGTRDVIAFGTITAVNDTNFPTALDTRITNAAAEVIELTAANVTAIDYATVPVDVIKLGAAAQNIAITNVLTNDTLIVTADILDNANGGAGAVEVAGASPNQTFRIELSGVGVDIKGKANNDALDVGLKVSSNITTIQIDSTATTADQTNANTIVSQDAGAVAINNVSAQSLTITGNQALTITGNGAAVGFANGIEVTASSFTGVLDIELSNSNDVITSGTGNDVIAGAQGNDTINIGSGGNDKIVFGTHANNGKDTITGFTGGANADTLNIAALGDGSTQNTLTATISSAGAQAAFVDDTYYIINTTGAAANITTGGTATITDFTNLTQVAAYLNERFTAAANDDEGVFIVNVTGTSNAYVYSFDNDGTAGLAAADFALVGIITTTGALVAANIVVT